MSEADPQVLERSALRRDLGLWSGLLAGPIAWALHMQICYALVPRICAGLNRWVLHAVSLVCLLIALAGTAIAWRLCKARAQPSAASLKARSRRVSSSWQ